MHRKEVLADLSRVFRRSPPSALAPSGVAGISERSVRPGPGPAAVPALEITDRAGRNGSQAASIGGQPVAPDLDHQPEHGDEPPSLAKAPTPQAGPPIARP